MADAYLAAQKADGKIRLTIGRLLEKYPFHVRVLERFKLVARREVGTMAAAVSSDSIVLLHNPTFVLDTPADQLGGVLLHEVHHVVLGHILTDPANFPDDWGRTVAEEVTANEFVNELLPAGAITLDQFTALPPLESTRRRYDRLKKTKRWRLGIVPGHRRQAIKPKILAVLDTSGSVDPDLLATINAELARLARHFTVKVVECDAAIQRIYDYRPVKEVQGRGGTDLQLPLEAAFLRKHRPDLVIYFADGHGLAAERAGATRDLVLNPGGGATGTLGTGCADGELRLMQTKSAGSCTKSFQFRTKKTAGRTGLSGRFLAEMGGFWSAT